MQLKIAYSKLMNAQIALTAIMSDLDKLMEPLFFIRCGGLA